jgi:hypothetical protein
MGTNYYLHTEVCPHCGRSDEPLHIGKSSAGWCFSLHVYPDKGISTLEDWKDIWSNPKSVINDEYSRTVTPEDMLDTIANRYWHGVQNTSHRWLAENYAEIGPNHLARHAISEGHCIGHGEGTWDYIVGEFS